MSRSLRLPLMFAVAAMTASAAPALARKVAAPPTLRLERLAPDAALPAPIKVKGKRTIAAYRYTGADGAPGYLVLSSTSTSGKSESRQLYAQLYAGAKLAQVRLVQDGVQRCALDLTASFVTGSVSVDDVDGDGRAEIAFAYDIGCDATERPTPRKLLILEGTAKFALRGVGRGKDLDGNPIGGEYKADAFKNEGAIATWAEARWNELLDVAPVAVDP